MKILYLSSIFLLHLAISIGIGFSYRLDNLEDQKTQAKINIGFTRVQEDLLYKRQEFNVKYQRKINKNKRKSLSINSNLLVK